MSNDKPLPPPDDFADNPELGDEFFKNARRGAPWIWERTDRMREIAESLRAQADEIEAAADALDGGKPKATAAE